MNICASTPPPAASVNEVAAYTEGVMYKTVYYSLVRNVLETQFRETPKINYFLGLLLGKGQKCCC